MNFIQKNILKDVARSFYLSLHVLPAPVRPVMSAAYLLCRAADSIADTPVVASGKRYELIKEFQDAMGGFPLDTIQLASFAGSLQPQVAQDDSKEATLLSYLDTILSEITSLPLTDQALIQKVFFSVTAGMLKDLEFFGSSDEPVRALPDQASLEAYIGWIGGGPGRFWAEVCREHLPQAQIDPSNAGGEEAYQFGTGLQMINILRDLPRDLADGRCYIPRDLLEKRGLSAQKLLDSANNDEFLLLYHQLIDEAYRRLEAGVNYIQKIPRGQFRLRAAAWWPLLIGLETLKKLKREMTILGSTSPIKVTRGEIYGLLGTSLLEIPSNTLLKQHFLRAAAVLSSPTCL